MFPAYGQFGHRGKASRSATPEKTLAPPEKQAEKRAREVARQCDYDVKSVERVLLPLDEGGETEVLFIGRYRGDQRANIPGDDRDARLPYRVWLTSEGGCVTGPGW